MSYCALSESERHADRLETVLQRWGEWLRNGACSLGYPAINVLHRNWSPPASGMRPGMRASAGADDGVLVLHGAIAQLGQRLRNTLVVVYVQRVPVEQRGIRLGCAESTVRARIREAKDLLRCMA